MKSTTCFSSTLCVFILFNINDTGYIIVDMEDNSIPEFSKETKNNKVVDVNKKYYYNGPLTYFEDSNGRVIDINTKEDMGKISELKNKKVKKQKNIDNTLAKENLKDFGNSTQIQSISHYSGSSGYLASSSVEYGLPYSLPNYSYNPNGICGATASAMFARYFNDHINGGYVPYSLETYDGEALTKELVKYIIGPDYVDPSKSAPGQTAYQVSTGFKSYLTSQNVSDSMYYKNSIDYSRVRERIGNGRPFMYLMNNHPKYGNHWVTASGYVENSGTFIATLAYIRVNDGWGSTNIYIDNSYGVAMVW